MKIRYYEKGVVVVEFNEYFKTVDDLKNFIKEKNRFINVDVLNEKFNELFINLTNLEHIIKYSTLDWFIVNKLNFKYKRPNNLNFWIERGFTIKEFNKYVGNKIEELDDNTENTFKFNKFTFKMTGKPNCNICNSNLLLKPTIGRYEINGCSNNNCSSYKNENIKTIKQFAFLPKELFNKNNKRINIESKLTKEYWLLKGLTYDESLIEIEKCREMITDVIVNSFEFYKITTDMNDDSIKYKLREQSQFCVEFWLKKGLNEKESLEKIKKIQKNNSLKGIELRIKNPEKYTSILNNQIGYWVKKGYTIEESKKIISERQRTFSLEKCIEKYGKVDGVKKFKDRQHKWLKSYKRNNFSKISQELFWDIIKNEPNITDREIYFATYNNGIKDESGKNNEYRLKLRDSVILPDFFDKKNKKIIEFDGTYYHRKTPENLLREEKRDKMIIDCNYKVFHVNETVYKNNKQEIIKKCINFLNE